MGYLFGLYIVAHDGNEYEHGLNKALDMAIEALSADTISREKAIYAIDLCRERKNKEIDELRTKWLEAEQRADRPHGEWIVDTYNMELRCEICGENFRFDNVDELLDYKEYAKYCLACGARMI